MKKFITVFGSLMIIAGLKAQKAPDIKKETTAPVNTRIDSMKNKSALPDKQQVSGVIPKTNPVNSNQKQFLPNTVRLRSPKKLTRQHCPTSKVQFQSLLNNRH